MSRYSQRYSYGPFGIGGWTPAVKVLVATNVIAFLLQIFDRVAGGSGMVSNFGLTPAEVTQKFYLWQLVTYMFLHDSGQLFHILFNMLGLWMFGSELERTWGTRQFTKFYFICGIGAGILTVLFSPGSPVSTIGASGAIYGILAAFGILFPNRIIYWIIFPIPAKWFVLILGGMAFFSSLSASGGGVAHIAHLGGMLCGLLYMKGGTGLSDIRYHYDRWRRNRLRRKFDVYYNERHRDEDQGRDPDTPPRWRKW